MHSIRFTSLFMTAVLICGTLPLLTSGCDEEKDSNSSSILLLLGSPTPGPKRMFVTDTAYNGNLGGVTGADALCRSDANKPAGGTWKALIAASGRTYTGDWVLQPDTTYYRADGTTEIFTTNVDAIFDFLGGSFTNSITTDDVQVWTGMNDDWTNKTDGDCNDWTDATNAFSGRTGDANEIDSSVVYLGEAGSSITRPFICVEQ